MARIFDDFLVAVFLAMANTCCVTVAMAAPLASDQLPLDWPSASRQDAGNAKAQELVDGSHAAYLAGEFAAAVVLNTELLQLKPADPRIYYNRGNAYYKMRDLERALADFNEALKIAPKLYFALMSRGNVYSQKQRFDEAIADYDRAIALKPDQFLIYFNRGIAFGRRGDFVKALLDFDEAIRLNPQDALSYSSRADVFYLQRDFERAARDYAQTVKLDVSLAHAGERLRIIASREKMPSQTANSNETNTFANGVSQHGAIEQLVFLVRRACFDNGEDERGLKALAAGKNWTAVGENELRKASSQTTTMVNGWTFSGDVGSVAIMQSRVNNAPGLFICSMTARLATADLLKLVRTEFEKQFKATPTNPVEQANDSTIRYWLPHRPTCDAKASLIISREHRTITIRMLHGRKADGA